jgi:hypothetical protein
MSTKAMSLETGIPIHKYNDMMISIMLQYYSDLLFARSDYSRNSNNNG